MNLCLWCTDMDQNALCEMGFSFQAEHLTFTNSTCFAIYCLFGTVCFFLQQVTCEQCAGLKKVWPTVCCRVWTMKWVQKGVSTLTCWNEQQCDIMLIPGRKDFLISCPLERSKVKVSYR